MIRRFFLMAALLLPRLANGTDPGADLLVSVVPPGSTPPAPAQASVAGFNTLVFNQDLSTVPLDVGCFSAGRSGGGKHVWYQGLWYEYPYGPPCSQIFLTHDDGQNVLDLQWVLGQPSGGYGQTSIETIAPDGSNPTDFIHGYFEAIMRVKPFTSGGQWVDFWTWTTVSAQSAGLANEIDVVEIHSEIPTLYVVSNHQWSNPGSPAPGAVLKISGIDFTKYHKFGLLWTGDGMSSGRLCYYLDDIERFCSNTTVLEETTRHFLILANGVGCAFAANSDFCINKPVTNATNSGGRVRLAVNQVGGSVHFNENDRVVVADVTGVPGANGTFTVSNVVFSGGVTAFDLNASTFSGAYTGGGTVNPTASNDLLVKSVRVWQ
jgi:hypothetical protein